MQATGEKSNGRDRGLPPGPKAGGVSQTLRWMFRPIPLMERCRKRYGPLFSMRLGPAKVLMIADASLGKQVMAGDPAVYRAGDTNGLFRPVVGSHSILLLDGAEHLHHRRILLPAFSGSHARDFADQVRETAERRIADWEEGSELVLQDEMEAISFESIMRVVFGDAHDDHQERLRALVPEMMDRCDSPFTLIPWFRHGLAGSTPYARLMRVIAELDEVLYEVIDERRADPLSQLRDDVLSLLLRARDEAGETLPEAAIRDELLTMIMAGYETTTSGLAWAFERLLRSPDQMERLVSELARGGEEYLDAVVKETLRCRPVIPVVARRLSEQTWIGDRLIPAGTILMVSIYLIHNDPEHYPEPERFLPERFLDGSVDSAAWIPFGGGVRRCLGASFAQVEMRTVLREVASSVELSTVSERDEETRRKRFTFAPGDGARARVERVLTRRESLASRRFRPGVEQDTGRTEHV